MLARCCGTLRVVPAKAGTHTPRPLFGYCGLTASHNQGWWLWVPAFAGTTSFLALRPCPRKRKAAHRADAYFARNTIARDLAGELERQRHRVGDGDLPGDVVAVGLAVENLGRIAVGGLCTRQRAAGILQAERRIPIPHRRAHGDVPVSVDGHSRISSSCLRKTGKRFWDRAKLPAV